MTSTFLHVFGRSSLTCNSDVSSPLAPIETLTTVERWLHMWETPCHTCSTGPSQYLRACDWCELAFQLCCPSVILLVFLVCFSTSLITCWNRVCAHQHIQLCFVEIRPHSSFCEMSEAWTGEDSFACPVCLDVLKDPTTLPCGHSYCLSCIQSHWDKELSKGQYSCPQCRQIFNPRPSLARSTVLAEAMEKLRTNSLKERSSTASAPSAPPSMPIYEEVLPALGPRKGSAYPQLPPVEAKLCPQHNRPLDLFCCEDRECVCEGCCQYGHKGHRVLKPRDERKERQVSNWERQFPKCVWCRVV